MTISTPGNAAGLSALASADGSGGYMLPEAFISRISESKETLIVFSVVRNERLRIRHWLEHYRRAGVRIFAVIDNGSTDGTFELLGSQPDVILTRMTHSYGGANFGLTWLNELHERIAPGTWILFADADELLVYRGWPNRPVQVLADAAASESSNAIFGFMLDMYPDGALEDAVVGDAASLFETAPCFDADYRFRLRPLKPWERGGRSIEVIGGPRVRLLSSLDREFRTTWFSYFLRGQIDRILPIVPDALVPSVVRWMPRQMPALAKVPLVMSGTGFVYSNAHSGHGSSFFHENVVLAHFKFLPDFAARVREEVTRGEHYRRGAEYHMYADAIRGQKRIDFRYAGSRRFAGSEQLLELGLIRDIRPLVTNGTARNASRRRFNAQTVESGA
jgi:glycosyltransferase involved in cell wall biosynthesis